MNHRTGARGLAALGAGLSLCLPAAAAARRLAHVDEKSAIIAAVRHAHELSPALTAACLRVYVSTVDRNWATMQFVYTPRCEREDGDGIAIVHRTSGHWRLVGAGSDFTCPLPGQIPRRVQTDLKLLCTARN